jgi:hypothetical protein
MSRPTPVTVICVLLLLLSGANLLLIAVGLWQGAADSVFKVPTAGANVAIGLVLTAICAFFMLQGANWARWVYLVWVAVGTIALFFIARWPSLLLGIIKTCVFAYFLTRRDADHFFKASRNGRAASSDAA